jgi:hypothetical protein
MAILKKKSPSSSKLSYKRRRVLKWPNANLIKSKVAKLRVAKLRVARAGIEPATSRFSVVENTVLSMSLSLSGHSLGLRLSVLQTWG